MKLVLPLLLLAACASQKSAPAPAAPDNVVQLTVTEKGFEPTPVRVKAGQPVKLTITRKTDDTCATEIVVKDYNLREKLPLGTPVTLTFTPTKTGELKYGCGMDQMVNGVLLVE